MGMCENCGCAVPSGTDATKPELCSACVSEYQSLHCIMLRYARPSEKDIFKWYADAVQRTESPDFHEVDQRVLHAAIGMATEVGELLDAVKKAAFYGKRLDMVNLFEEAGDIQWYFMLLCVACGWSVPAILQANVEKLQHRYPKQFENFKALNRDLHGERQVLEDGHNGNV